MKPWLALLCMIALVTPAVAAEVDPSADLSRDVLAPVTLYPGDVFNGYYELDSLLWADYDVWIFIAVGSAPLELEMTDYGSYPDTVAIMLLEYQVGYVAWDYATNPAPASVSVDVDGVGIYLLITGYMEDAGGGFGKGYYVDATFGTVVSECTAPQYNPSKWNDGGTVQYNNNCYNYANDERTDTFAQPGKAGGCYPWSLNCANVYDAAECDGLIGISSITSPCPPGMHRVHLVTRPGWDYHFYRQDLPNGMWSHKPGSTAARDRDDSGQLISNPDYADIGFYTDHCGYLCACGDNADIR